MMKVTWKHDLQKGNIVSIREIIHVKKEKRSCKEMYI